MSDKMNPSNGDDFGRDVELGEKLGLLDPARIDPNYWMRFRQWVVTNAAPELARRRLMADITVGDVMTSWARAVLPTAALAAAVAALILVRGPAVEAPQLVSVEELLLSGLEGETIPSTLGADDASVAFASEIF